MIHAQFLDPLLDTETHHDMPRAWSDASDVATQRNSAGVSPESDATRASRVSMHKEHSHTGAPQTHEARLSRND